ncbi:hypothetical protein SynROS8604_01460 [Synechococcus sp. ROS8604]|nr:hypothetical protein SynROS8604_01460 [Synechococcus sp. ROS8604]
MPQTNDPRHSDYSRSTSRAADGSGVLGRLAYEMTSGVTAGVNVSYDEAFDTRVSADLKVRFGGPSTTAAKKKKWENPTINALTASPKNRDVRVHDKTGDGRKCISDQYVTVNCGPQPGF